MCVSFCPGICSPAVGPGSVLRQDGEANEVLSGGKVRSSLHGNGCKAHWTEPLVFSASSYLEETKPHFEKALLWLPDWGHEGGMKVKVSS